MSGPPDIAGRKRTLRDQMKRALNAMCETDRAAASRAACERLAAMPLVRSATTIMAYLPLPGEADCTSIIETALDAQKIVAVPLVDWNNRGMHAARLSSLDPEGLVADRHGVRTPRVIEAIPFESLDVIIVPGLAFDATGRRLGRGGGFYDRFLAMLPDSAWTIGLCFESQLVPQIPAEPHDARVRFIATESRLIDCG